VAVTLSTPARRPASALADWNRVASIFHRDRRLALSYSASFYLSWLNILVEVNVAFFLSILLHPSARFGWNGHVGTYFGYLVVNFAIIRFQTTALTAFAEAIRDGQMMGTLEVMLATPTSLPLLVLSSGLWAFTLTGFQTAAYLIIAFLYHLDFSHLNVLTAVVFFTLMILSISPVGVVAAAATMLFKKTGPVEWFMTSVSTIFAGVYLPISLLPGPLKLISWLLPLSHVLNGLRAAFFGASLRDVAPDALWLCASTVILLPVALWFFALAVRRSKVDGSLGLY